MAETVSDALIQRIRDWGVTRVFGFPGDGIGEFDGALGKAEREGDGLEYIRPTHEEICAFMATAHWAGRRGRATGSTTCGRRTRRSAP